MLDYIVIKLKLLKQFDIKLSKNQKNHFLNLSTEIAVDNYARSLLLKYL